MKESQIRPPELKEAQERAKEADRTWLRGYPSRFVGVNCPACAGYRSSPKWQKHGFAYRECADCRMVYMSPRPTETILAAYHLRSENYKYWAEHIFPATDDVRLEEIHLPRAERILRLCKEQDLTPTKLLDVGTGYGTFCRAMRRIDPEIDVFAIEPVPALAEVCERDDILVFDRPVDKLHFAENTFGVITAWEVVEHVFSPRAFLEKCLAWLKPDGLLFLSCPNVKGFDVSVLGQRSGTVEHEHLNYFHPESLSALLTDVGFNVLEISTPGKLDAELARKAALDGTLDLSDRPFLRHVLIEDWERLGPSFQVWLAENGLSSHMQTVCQKWIDDAVL